MANKKQRTDEETYTQVVSVVSSDDEAQINKIMYLCGIPRSLTYNKLGSLQGWSLDWKKADAIIRTIIKPGEVQAILVDRTVRYLHSIGSFSNSSTLT